MHYSLSLKFSHFFIASAMETTMITIFFAVAVTITKIFQFATTTILLLGNFSDSLLFFVLILAFFWAFGVLLNDIAAFLRVILSSLVGSTSLPENSIRSSSLYLFTRIQPFCVYSICI